MCERKALNPWILFIFTFCLVFLPLYLYYKRFSVGAVFDFLAADAFYYLDVARYSQGLSFYTFDGLHATNGFHPLWQYLITWLAHFRWFSFSGQNQLTHFFLLDLFLVSVGTGLLSIFAARQVRRFWLGPLALCPGLTWILFSIANSNYLSVWSYVNGMESGLSLLCFGLALLCFTRGMFNGWRLYLGAFFLGCAVLSRLDDVFFLLAFFLYSIASASQHRRRAALPFALPFLLIATYLFYNHHTVHLWLPVSGSTKSSFALVQNVFLPIFDLLPLAWDQRPSPTMPFLGFSNWAELTMRLFQLWFPIILCGGFLIVVFLRRRLRFYPVLSCLCAGAFLKGLYNLCFVAIWAQGHWYYPVSIFTCNVVLAVALDKLLDRAFSVRLSSHLPLANAGIFGLLAVFNWFCFFGVVAHKSAEQYGLGSNRMYDHGSHIAQDIRGVGAKSYLELDDGLIAYASGMPGTSAIGLTLDREGLDARKEGMFFERMDQRGIHFIVAAGSYGIAMNQILQAGAEPTSMLGGIHPSEFDQYSIKSALRDEKNDITLYQIVRKAPNHTPGAMNNPH